MKEARKIIIPTKNDYSGPTFELDTMRMIENQMYAVFLFLKKDKRVDIAYQVLDLVEGDPPELGIR